MKAVYYAMYSRKQQITTNTVYSGLDVDGKPYTATELLKTKRKSYWPDGRFVTKVYDGEWYTYKIPRSK